MEIPQTQEPPAYSTNTQAATERREHLSRLAQAQNGPRYQRQARDETPPGYRRFTSPGGRPYFRPRGNSPSFPFSRSNSPKQQPDHTPVYHKYPPLPQITNKPHESRSRHNSKERFSKPPPNYYRNEEGTIYVTITPGQYTKAEFKIPTSPTAYQAKQNKFHVNECALPTEQAAGEETPTPETVAQTPLSPPLVFAAENSK